MTDYTMVLYGWLGIGTLFLCIGLVPVAGAQIRDPKDWRRNMELRITAGTYIAMAAASLLFLSALAAPVIHRSGLSQYLIWGALSLGVLAEWLFISVVGRFQLTIALSSLWAIFVYAMRWG